MISPGIKTGIPGGQAMMVSADISPKDEERRTFLLGASNAIVGFTKLFG